MVICYILNFTNNVTWIKKGFKVVYVHDNLPLGACGTEKDSAEDVKEENSTVAEQQTGEQKEGKGSDVKEEETNGDVESKVPTIKETVLWDNNNVKITAQELLYTQYSDSVSYAEVKLLIENNNDTQVKVVAGSMGYCCNAINGYMVFDGHINEVVRAGETVTTYMQFYLEDLAIYGIQDIAEIQVGFDIQIDNEDRILTGPQMIKTSVAESFDKTINTYHEMISGDTLMQKTEYVLDSYVENKVSLIEGLDLVSGALMTDDDGEPYLFLEVQNNTEKELRCTGVDLTINDIRVYTIDMTNYFVAPSCRCIMQYDLDGYIPYAYKEAFGITSLDKIDITLKIEDKEYLNVLAEQDTSFVFAEKQPVEDVNDIEVYNQNGIRMVSKGVFVNEPEDTEAYCWVLLIESQYPEELIVETQQGSEGALFVNGIKMDYFDCKLLPAYFEEGKYTAVYVSMGKDTLSQQGINEIADISDLEIGIVFRTMKYNEVAEAIIKVEGLPQINN